MLNDNAAAPVARRTRRGSGRATVADVARLAGVSTQTVSRVLNTPDRVPERTVTRVRDAMEQAGYVPNLLAGGLASGRSRLVAALVPTIASPIFLETIQALTATLAEHGYQLMVAESGHDDTRECELLDAIIGRRPDGIVLTRIVRSEQARRRLLASGIPVVETWDLTPTPLDMLIGFSHDQVGATVAEYFHAHGRQYPAVIAGDDPRAGRRGEAFAKAVKRLGFAGRTVPKIEVPAPATLGAGRAGLARLLEQAPDTDAVFCSTDVIAHGVLIEARVRGIRVPQDLAVIGFGDFSFARDTDPALTTVRIDGTAIGGQAARFIVERAEGREVTTPVIDLGFSLVERGTA
jgi:LacI family gluconate utilization system Gnt-I transcriptional repressor